MWASVDCFCVVQLKENQSFAAFRPSDMNIMLIECQPFEIEVFKHLTSLTDGVPVLYMSGCEWWRSTPVLPVLMWCCVIE